MERLQSEKKSNSGYDLDISSAPNDSREDSIKHAETEVFSAGEEGVDFRTVGWIRGTNVAIPISESLG